MSLRAAHAPAPLLLVAAADSALQVCSCRLRKTRSGSGLQNRDRT